MLAVGCEADAGDEAHDVISSSFRDNSISIRLRKAEHLLADEAEDQLRADRRDARDQRFPQIALDVILLGIAEAAMGHHRLLAGLEAGFRGKVLCGIRRR